MDDCRDDGVDEDSLFLDDGAERSGLIRAEGVFLESTLSRSARLRVFTSVSLVTAMSSSSLAPPDPCALAVSDGTVAADAGTSGSPIKSSDPLRSALSLDIKVEAPPPPPPLPLPLSDASTAEAASCCCPIPSHGESSFSLLAELKSEGRASGSFSSEPEGVEVMLAMWASCLRRSSL